MPIPSSLVITPQPGVYSVRPYVEDSPGHLPADCTAGIMRALADSPANGICWFPPGTYPATTVDIADLCGVTVVMAPGATLLGIGSGPVIRCKQNGNGGVTYLHWYGGRIDGGGLASFAVQLLYKSSSCIFEDVKMRNVAPGTGCFVGIGNGDQTNQVDWCSFKNCEMYQEASLLHARAAVKVHGDNCLGNRIVGGFSNRCADTVWAYGGGSMIELLHHGAGYHKNADSALIQIERVTDGASNFQALVSGGYVEAVANIVRDTGVTAECRMPITIRDLIWRGGFGVPVQSAQWTRRQPLILDGMMISGNLRFDAGGSQPVWERSCVFDSGYSNTGANASGISIA